jgi:hypothetical protein
MNVFPWELNVNYDLIEGYEWIVAQVLGASGKEWRGTPWSLPRRRYTLSYSYLSPDDMESLVGFYLQQKSLASPFFYAPILRPGQSHQIANQSLGTGDGSETDFQIIRSWGGYYDETIQYLNPYPPYFGWGEGGWGEGFWGGGGITGFAEPPYVYLDGVLQYSGYSIGTDSVITFDAPPGVGVEVTVDFSFFVRCRFEEALGGQLVFYNLYNFKEVSLVEVK